MNGDCFNNRELLEKVFITLVVFKIVILIKLFTGIYIHDEFGERHFFIKYRPIWKTIFYSPRGMSDRKLSEMTTKEQTEQKLYMNSY